jgi:hypothetical protein
MYLCILTTPPLEGMSIASNNTKEYYSTPEFPTQQLFHETFMALSTSLHPSVMCARRPSKQGVFNHTSRAPMTSTNK